MSRWQDQSAFKASPGNWHFKIEVQQRAVDWERMKVAVDPARMKSIEFEGEPSSKLELVIVSAINDILDSCRFIVGPEADRKAGDDA